MKKRLGKKLLEKEARFWVKAKSALSGDEVRMCRK